MFQVHACLLGGGMDQALSFSVTKLAWVVFVSRDVFYGAAGKCLLDSLGAGGTCQFHLVAKSRYCWVVSVRWVVSHMLMRTVVFLALLEGGIKEPPFLA